MSSTESPMNIAHQHAASAEEHLRNGLLMLAAEEHGKAASSYQAAIERNNDESAKRAMRMLFNENRKAVADLERKIAKLKAEGKDPTLPQKPDVARTNTASSPASVHHPQQPYAGPSHPPSNLPGNNTMMESHATVDESFMVLAGQRSDPGDAFNQFWNIMQGMMDNLSQPVAFATAPLDANDSSKRKGKEARREGSASSDTDIDEPMVSRISRKLGMSAGGRSSPKLAHPASPLRRTSGGVDASSTEEETFDDDNDLSESFFMIPSAKETMALKRENVALKSEADALRKRLEATEKVLQLRKEQDLHLRDSIYMATKEAQRAIGSSAVPPRQMVDHINPAPSSPNPNLPPIPGYHTAREAQYGRRVKELEDEIRLVRVDLEKARMENTKYRDRWNKVKESAKRKKELKAGGSGGGEDKAVPLARERIDEEPEAEELAETAA